MKTLNCMLQAGPQSLHYYCVVVLHSCIVLPPAGHSSNHEYHCRQLTTDNWAVFQIFITLLRFPFDSPLYISLTEKIRFTSSHIFFIVPLQRQENVTENKLASCTMSLTRPTVLLMYWLKQRGEFLHITLFHMLSVFTINDQCKELLRLVSLTKTYGHKLFYNVNKLV